MQPKLKIYLNLTSTAQIDVWTWKTAAYNEVANLPNDAQIPFIHEKVSAITKWIKEQQALKNKTTLISNP
jgi:hypothetical protein